jgi:selenocysteine-specific elongation factor
MTHLAERGAILREGVVLRLPSHRVSTTGREDADRLVAAVQQSEPTPRTVRELHAAGFGPELIRAVCEGGRLVRISPDIVITPAFLARAEEVVRARTAPPGLTVSSFREGIGTSRKYALPILEFFDARGITRRQGGVRLARTEERSTP